MTDKKLLNQALEYLEDNQHWVADGERHAYVMEYNAFIDKLKQALAQPQQEPVAWMTPDMEQCESITHSDCDCRPLVYGDTTPPQRTWVGLTDDDMPNKELDAFCRGARWADAKLKEKNT